MNKRYPIACVRLAHDRRRRTCSVSSDYIRPNTCGGAVDGVTLDVLAVSQPPQLDCLQMAADEFSEQTGATVNINGQGYGQLRDAALAAFVGGLAPLTSLALLTSGPASSPSPDTCSPWMIS